MGNFLKQFVKHPLVINLVVAFCVTIGIIYAALCWLDIYTKHNEAVVVPDVKGLRGEKAAAFFESNGLKYDVIDSVYSKQVSPGAIVELVPEAGSKVKEGRIVFLTINAESAQTSAIPEVEDLSYRQAYALLQSKGFENIEIEYVPGDYKDLAVAVEAHGRTLHKGERVALETKLVLVVSNGEAEVEEDSLNLGEQPLESLDSEEENWF